MVFSTLQHDDALRRSRESPTLFRPAAAYNSSRPGDGARCRVLTQMLIARSAGGRVPAAELLMIGYGARSTSARMRYSTFIRRSRSPNGTARSPARRIAGTSVRKGLITPEDARTRTVHADELDGLLRPRTRGFSYRIEHDFGGVVEPPLLHQVGAVGLYRRDTNSRICATSCSCALQPGAAVPPFTFGQEAIRSSCPR